MCCALPHCVWQTAVSQSFNIQVWRHVFHQTLEDCKCRAKARNAFRATFPLQFFFQLLRFSSRHSQLYTPLIFFIQSLFSFRLPPNPSPTHLTNSFFIFFFPGKSFATLLLITESLLTYSLSHTIIKIIYVLPVQKSLNIPFLIQSLSTHCLWHPIIFPFFRSNPNLSQFMYSSNHSSIFPFRLLSFWLDDSQLFS